MAKKKVFWQTGDVFAVPLLNGKFCVGQIIDLQMTNVVRCAYYNEVIDLSKFDISTSCLISNVIAIIASTKEHLDFGVWRIIGNKNIFLGNFTLPNEQFRAKNWLGAKVYDASIVEEFINAYFALSVWDDWADPYYLDALLIEKSKKPSNLLLKSK